MTQQLVTCVYEQFAGRRRKFELNIGTVGEVERLAQAGIGAIMMRLATHQFTLADVRETIRLGLEGGGAPEAEATALVLRYVDPHPLSVSLPLAAKIVTAFVEGLPKEPLAKKDGLEGNGETPATSPASTAPAE